MLIDLSDPKNVASRGDVPESVHYLVEVQRVEGQQEPPFFLGPFSGEWSVNPVAKELSDSSDNSIRHARPATAAEIAEHEAKCSAKPDASRKQFIETLEDTRRAGDQMRQMLCPEPSKPLSVGRYVVEGGKAYRMMEGQELIDIGDEWEGCETRIWYPESFGGSYLGQRVDKTSNRYRRPLPSDASTYAILQAAWVEHFNVKVGTRVRVGIVPYESLGLEWDHAVEMSGKETDIEHIWTHGIQVGEGPYCTLVPFHVLEPLPESQGDENDEEIDGIPGPGYTTFLPALPAAPGEGDLHKQLAERTRKIEFLHRQHAKREQERNKAEATCRDLRQQLTALRAEVKRLSDACAKEHSDWEELSHKVDALTAENKRMREAAESVMVRLKKDAMRITGGELLELADDLTAAMSTSEGGK